MILQYLTNMNDGFHSLQGQTPQANNGVITPQYPIDVTRYRNSVRPYVMQLTLGYVPAKANSMRAS